MFKVVCLYVSSCNKFQKELSPDSAVGADPRLVPHTIWAEWDKNFTMKYLRLVHIRRNLIDLIWQHDRPEPKMFSIKVQPLNFAGERWESKVQRLKQRLAEMNVEAMVVTSLTEITWLLNVRGRRINITNSQDKSNT